MTKKSHPYKRIIQILGSIVSVGSAILSFVQIFQEQAGYSILLFVVSILSIIGVFSYSIIITIQDYQARISDMTKSHNEKLLAISHATHEYAGHLLRDSIFKMEKLIADGVYNDTILMDYVNTFGDAATEYLKLIFESVYEQPCVVNMRLIKPSFWDNSNISEDNRLDVKVYSCGRSGEMNATRRRWDEKTYYIRDDIGMVSIFVDQKSEFYRFDIQKNLSPDNPEKFLLLDIDKTLYDNVFTVPIRIKTHVLKQSLDNVNKNNLFGFLTVDFQDSKCIGEEQINYGLDFLKTFADSAYLYIENIRRYLKNNGDAQ